MTNGFLHYASYDAPALRRRRGKPKFGRDAGGTAMDRVLRRSLANSTRSAFGAVAFLRGEDECGMKWTYRRGTHVRCEEMRVEGREIDLLLQKTSFILSFFTQRLSVPVPSSIRHTRARLARNCCRACTRGSGRVCCRTCTPTSTGSFRARGRLPP